MDRLTINFLSLNYSVSSLTASLVFSCPTLHELANDNGCHGNKLVQGDTVFLSIDSVGQSVVLLVILCASVFPVATTSASLLHLLEESSELVFLESCIASGGVIPSLDHSFVLLSSKSWIFCKLL